jgi:hypothetical protein
MSAEESSNDESFPRAKRLKYDTTIPLIDGPLTSTPQPAEKPPVFTADKLFFLYGIQTPLELATVGLAIKDLRLLKVKQKEEECVPPKALGKVIHMRVQVLSLLPKKGDGGRVAEYKANDEGCFILEVQLPGGQWWCLDATRNLSSWGRYINHSHLKCANIKMYKPLLVRGSGGWPSWQRGT